MSAELECAHEHSPPFGEDANGGNDEMTCAICLNAIEPLDLAIVKGCFHEYCACCILKWAACKPDPAWCPKCKTPFSYLYLHRQLDGTVSDYPLEESVCLLKVAPWFVEHVREADKGKLLSGTSALAAPPGEEAYDDEEDYFDDEDDEDFYLARGSGRPRVVLGNRRLGENGFMRSGRMYARPVPPVPTSVRGKGGSNRKGGAQQSNGNSSSNSGSNPGPTPGAGSSSNGGGNSSAGGAGTSRAAGPSASSAAAGAAGPGPSSAARNSGAGASNSQPNAANNGAGSGGKQGRRAKRSARRAAYDLDLDDEYAY